MTCDIAVVIPFYKIKYFEILLHSLSHQTDCEFTVYVGNDGSDPEAEKIVQSFKKDLNIKYWAFEENFGTKDLAGQWNRCIQRVEGADWIWVVPDDDRPSRNCIEEIKRAVIIADAIGANTIHVACKTVDALGNMIKDIDYWPSVISSSDFYLRQLKGEASGATLGNIVYRRAALEAINKFISYPKGWGSDHATMLAVTAGRDIVTAQNAWLEFRMSGENISSMSNDAKEKMTARLLFADWLSKKCVEWYSVETSREIMRWFYFKSEHYVTKVWPFDDLMYSLLLEMANICNVPRSATQKGMVYLRGWKHTFLKSGIWQCQNLERFR